MTRLPPFARTQVSTSILLLGVGTPLAPPNVAEQFGARTGLGLGGLATVMASAALLWGLGHWHVGQLNRSHRPIARTGLQPE